MTFCVASADLKPSLSTALIKYVPVLAGDEAVVAGRATFGIKTTDDDHSAPIVTGEYLIS